MHITKYGQSCLFVEEGEAKILIDPGVYSFDDLGLKREDLPACNVLLITHEHPDHCDIEAIKTVLKKSTSIIITNAGVKKTLEDNGIIGAEILTPGQERAEHGVAIRGVACQHGLVASHVPRPDHIGFFVDGRLFHPGDCVAPSEEIHPEILALPVAAPWMACKEGVEFALRVKPKIAFPIHDAFLRHPEKPWYTVYRSGFEGTGTAFVEMPIGERKEF